MKEDTQDCYYTPLTGKVNSNDTLSPLCQLLECQYSLSHPLLGQSVEGCTLLVKLQYIVQKSPERKIR